MAKIRSDTASLSASMLRSYSETTPVNNLWNVFKQGIGNIMESVTTKMFSICFSLPWMNSNIKRLAWRTKWAYNKAKSIKDLDQWNRFNVKRRFNAHHVEMHTTATSEILAGCHPSRFLKGCYCKPPTMLWQVTHSAWSSSSWQEDTRKLSWTMNARTRPHCYSTLARTIMEYASTIRDPHTQKYVGCLEKTQTPLC